MSKHINFQEKVKYWQSSFFDTKTKEAINELLAHSPETLEDCFYKDLGFGTGGMRGIMGVGTNRINKYTLGKTTQGISNYLKKEFPAEQIKAVVAFDCRNNSAYFGEIVANIFSANTIYCYLFSELRPTPILSFAVRHLKAHCGIMITASHNPPEYNGYKVYWKDGGQIVARRDKEIIAAINESDYKDIQFKKKDHLIQKIDSKIDRFFCEKSLKSGAFDTVDKNNFKIVFTPLHGTSITILPKVLKMAGYKNVSIVKEQSYPDGNFSNVLSPNPENPEAFDLAIKKAEKIGADIIIATDPDSDRLGIGVRDFNKKIKLLNGNQMMVVLTYFLLEQLKCKKKINSRQFIASTIVSTPMIEKIARSYNIKCHFTLTGFKWIAKIIEDLPNSEFIAGGEESFGFMIGDWIRDKDAITTALLACEVANWAKNNHSTFFQLLIDCYVKFGFYKENLVAISKKGKKGALAIKTKMEELRKNPPKKIAGISVVSIDDFEKQKTTFLSDKKEKIIILPTSNVLIFNLEDKSKIAIRPSGTEPKIKFYFSVNAPLNKENDFFKIEKKLDAHLEKLKNAFIF